MVYVIPDTYLHFLIGLLYLLTIFIQFPCPYPTSGNHKSDLFFYNFFLSVFEDTFLKNICRWPQAHCHSKDAQHH